MGGGGSLTQLSQFWGDMKCVPVLHDYTTAAWHTLSHKHIPTACKPGRREESTKSTDILHYGVISVVSSVYQVSMITLYLITKFMDLNKPLTQCIKLKNRIKITKHPYFWGTGHKTFAVCNFIIFRLYKEIWDTKQFKWLLCLKLIE